MEDRSKKELEIKRESGVLYDPPDPLFPDIIKRKKIKLIRVVASLLFLCMIVTIFAIAVSGRRDRGENDGESNGIGSVSSGEAVSGVESELYDSETVGDEVGKNESSSDSENTESESGTDDSQNESDTGSSCESTENTERNDGESDQDSEIEVETDMKIVELDLSRTEEGEELVMNYSGKSPDISGLIDRGFVCSEEKGGDLPIVMIIHTHTSESYLGGASSSVFNSIAAVGDELSSKLNSFGVTSLHCTVIHDGDGSNAYVNARETIETMLRIYPSIRYIIDLHRLELEADGAIVKTVSGCSDGSAQIRLTVSSASGEAWQEDLSLALAIRGQLNQGGSRVCMPTVISPSRYNSDLSEFYLMADIGAVGNSVAEAKAAAVRLADAIRRVILK